MDKLSQTVDIAKMHDVDLVIWAGDVFHIKAPSRTSHALVQQAADVIRSYGRPTLIVPGNHDVQHDRLESLPLQPLGTLYKAGAIELVGDIKLTTPSGVHRVFGIPWLYDWEKDLPAYFDEWKKSEAPLLVTHAPIVRPGNRPPFFVIDAKDWAEGMGRPGDVYWGHMHDPDGWFPLGDFSFCNQGAISRGSLHESTLRRKPAVTLYESNSAEQAETFMRAELSHLPADKVFRLDLKSIEDDRVEKLDAFLSSVEKTELEGLSVEQVVAHVETLEVSSRTKDLVKELLEDVMSK